MEKNKTCTQKSPFMLDSVKYKNTRFYQGQPALSIETRRSYQGQGNMFAINLHA